MTNEMPQIIAMWSGDGWYYIKNGKTYAAKKAYEIPDEVYKDQQLQLPKATMTDAEWNHQFKIPKAATEAALAKYTDLRGDIQAEWITPFQAMEKTLQAAAPFIMNEYAGVVKKVEDMLTARIVELRKAGTFAEGIEAAAQWHEEKAKNPALDIHTSHSHKLDAAAIRKLKTKTNDE